MGKKGKRKQRTVGGAGSSGVVGTTKFTASTSGLEDVYFTWGTAKDAAKFEDTASMQKSHYLWLFSQLANVAHEVRYVFLF